MKKIILSLATLFVTIFSAIAQEASYIGQQATAVEIRGSSWLGDYTSLGWSVGAYSDYPDEKFNSLLLYNYSFNNIQIPANSKLILKVGGQNMILTTARGTNYEGSTVIIEKPMRYSINIYYATSVYYEVTQAQADSINTYGISKYRYQVNGTVFEREGMNYEKIARKMKKVYEKILVNQSKVSDKVNDLSDF